MVPQHPTASFNLGICYEKVPAAGSEATDSFNKALTRRIRSVH